MDWWAGTTPLFSDGLLTLRRQHPDDLEMQLEAVDDEQIDWLWEAGHRAEWQRMSVAEQREHQRRHLQAVHDSFGPGPKWCFSVDALDVRYVVYIDCDLANPHVPLGEANISYTCHPAHRGKGYTTRAVRLVCMFLLRHTNASEAHIVVDARNAVSLGVARAAGAVERERFRDAEGRTKVRHVINLRGA